MLVRNSGVNRLVHFTIWTTEKSEYQKILLNNVKKRKLTYYGHMARKQEDCIEKDIVQIQFQEEEIKEDRG